MSKHNFVVSGCKSSPPNFLHLTWNGKCRLPLVDISIHSRDIHGQSRKLS